MQSPFAFSRLLLLTSALIAPAALAAQTPDAPPASTPPSAPPSESVPDAQTEQETTAPDTPQPGGQPEVAPEVSIPGAGEVVVTGSRNRDLTRATPQVVSVLSTADIARTGEGNIASALGRVTGLSVVGNGFVYVRGLGDRYSLALLNGSPLPSPEPLKRVVPLDVFPTNVIASSLVQKSYSANFPGEFGGGVINLTTRAVPNKSFVTIGLGGGYDTETTNRLGYTYYGSGSDWTGFDGGARSTPPALRAFLDSGQRISEGTVDTQAIASQFVTANNGLVQRNTGLPANVSGTLSAGTKVDIGDDVLGIIATVGYSNKWRTRDTIQQTAASVDLSQTEQDFRRVITDNRVVVNGLLGLGYETGAHKLRWTNLYIRDTIKQARLGQGTRATTSPTATLLQQDTAWFARELIDSQAVAELRFGKLSIDLRGALARSRRNAPFELSLEYYRSNLASDPLGSVFINKLNNGQRGSAEIVFSRLKETLKSAGADVSYKITPGITGTLGYAFNDTGRRTERRDFLFTAPSSFPDGVAALRPDALLSPGVIDFYDIALVDTNEANPVFDARLLNHAGYGQLQARPTSTLSLNAGVRYESARQTVSPVQVFNTPTASLAGTALDNDYWLPAATLTWQPRTDMQFRLSGSRTIARPQFRELIYQLYFDPDSNRQFRGNPLLTDSELTNAEARYEWYFAREQRLSLAGFWKKIDRPIEAFASFSDNAVVSSFANAPRATLYGAELEAQKYFDLAGLGSEDGFFADRRAVVIANYTFTKSKVSVGASDTVAVFAASSTRALDFFRDGAPLTGQSDHLVNLQLGLEDKSKLSQQTVLITYASKRITNRGAALQPDIYERPGINLDFVARQGVELGGGEAELKLEVRNILGNGYREYQQSGANRVFYNRYDVGTSINFGIGLTF